MDILIKVSGDLVESNEFYDWLESINHFEDKLFVLCGGGTLITKELNYQRIPFEFGPAGREISSERGKFLAKRALESQASIIEARSKWKGLKVTVLAPSMNLGDKICHLNGDKYLVALYPNFDKIYVVTLEGRTKAFPEELNRIEVVYL